MSSSRTVVSTPSVSVFEDESPSRGLSRSIDGGVGRLSDEPSESSTDCGNSGLKNNELRPYVWVESVSVTLKGTG